MKKLLILLLVLSIFIVSCSVQEVALDENGAVDTTAEEILPSPEEEEIIAGLDEIDDLEALEEELDLNLDELDNLNLE